ncbi:MAG: ABC transporter substrate-binding protein [Acidimicrobiales bacterium]
MSSTNRAAGSSAPLSSAAGLSRRAFLIRSGKTTFAVGVAAAGGGSLLAACGGSTSTSGNNPSSTSATKVKLQESYINNAEFAGYYIAAKKGYFAKYGLAVDILPAGATTDPRTVVADGGAAIGFVSETSDVLIGISQGVPYKCIGATFQVNPGCLMVLAKSDIYNIKDLEGKTIGLQDNARQQVLGILHANGVPLSSVKLQVVGDTPTPLVLGKIDAYTAFAFNEPIALKMQGIGTRCYSFSNIGLPGYGDNLIATVDTIKNQPDMLARFVRASQEAWQFSIDHPAEAVDVTLKDYPSGQNAEQQKLQMQVQIPMLANAQTKAHGLLWIDTTTWAQAIATAHSTGALAKPVTVAESMTQEILQRAANVQPV